MRTRTLAAVAAAVLIGLTGCNPAASPTGAGQSKPVDPSAELAAAVSKLTTESMRVETAMATGLNGKGVVDETGDQMQMTLSITTPGSAEGTTVDMRKVGTDVYLKFDGSLGQAMGGKSGKWLHIDSASVPAGSPFSPESNDPKSVTKLLASAAKVERTGERAWKGELDMTKSPTMTEQAKKSLGVKATGVPFTAKADAEGRLAEIVIDVETIAKGAGQMTTTYSDFGLEVSVEKPAGAVEMPKEMLGIVGA